MCFSRIPQEWPRASNLPDGHCGVVERRHYSSRGRLAINLGAERGFRRRAVNVMTAKGNALRSASDRHITNPVERQYIAFDIRQSHWSVEAGVPQDSSVAIFNHPRSSRRCSSSSPVGPHRRALLWTILVVTDSLHLCRFSNLG